MKVINLFCSLTERKFYPKISQISRTLLTACHNLTSFHLISLRLTSEEGLAHFQAGDLPENDQEWHRLVPPEAIEALGKTEVQRQSVIFEVFKAEREYVADLEAVQNVRITFTFYRMPTIHLSIGLHHTSNQLSTANHTAKQTPGIHYRSLW